MDTHAWSDRLGVGGSCSAWVEPSLESPHTAKARVAMDIPGGLRLESHILLPVSEVISQSLGSVFRTSHALGYKSVKSL